jgi:hypothetical protein
MEVPLDHLDAVTRVTRFERRMCGKDGALPTRTTLLRFVLIRVNIRDADRCSFSVCTFLHAQCVKEGWSEKIAEQNAEGCRVQGRILVNKVIGNFHFSHGRSFQTHNMHIQDLVPYLKDKNHHDFGHVIHKFQFEADNSGSVLDLGMEELTKSVKKRLGIVNPLDGAVVHPEVCE